MLNKLGIILVLVSYALAIPYPLPQSDNENEGGAGNCNEFQLQEWGGEIVACEAEASAFVEEAIAARESIQNILRAVCRKITETVTTLHNN